VKELAAELCTLSLLAKYEASSGLYLIAPDHYTADKLLTLKLLERLAVGDYSPELNYAEIELRMMCQEIRELRAMVAELGGDWDRHRRNFPQVLAL